MLLVQKKLLIFRLIPSNMYLGTRSVTIIKQPLSLSLSLCDSAHHFSFWRQKSKFCLAFSLLEKAEEARAPGICSDSATEFL